MKIKKTAVKIVLNKKAFILAFLVLSVIIIIAGYFMYKNSSSKSNKICIEGKTCFYAEIADTLGERERGLSGKQSLGDDKGMLFIFEEETLPGFWMKDMKFPIDKLWIDENKKIVGIEKNMQPCEEGKECPVFYPSRDIMYVFEINSGLSDAYGFEEGDSVYLR